MRISKSTHLVRLLQTQDVLIATLTYLFTVELAWFVDLFTRQEMMTHLWLTPLVLVLAILASTSRSPKLHGQSTRQHLLAAGIFAGVVVGGLLITVFASQFSELSRIVVFGYAVLLVTAFGVNRVFLSWYYLTGRKEHSENFLKVLIVGAGPRAQKLVETYKENSDWGIEIVCVLDPQPEASGPASFFTDIRPLNELESVLDSQVIDEVIVCTPRSFAANIIQVADACEEHGVCLKYMADLYNIETKQIGLEHFGKIPVLSFEPVAQDEAMLIVKRVIDLTAVLAALVVIIPMFILVGLIIKLDSKGPVFFLQSRVGLNKRQFRMIKFRSMYVDAEARLAEIEHLNEADGPIFKMKDDPRITRVGRFLRRSSIDELPQLFNVLLGHMSLIGPRPMSLRDVEQFSAGVQRKRFSVRPGLACLREVSGRSALTFDQWLELDLKYIEEWSLALDFKILVRLVPAVLAGDGAS